MGVPVVATDIRGCRQAVDDGVTGLLVPARDPDRARRRDRDARGRPRAARAAWARPRATRRSATSTSSAASTSPLSTYARLLERAGSAPTSRTRRDEHSTPRRGRRCARRRGAARGRIADGFLATLGPRFLDAPVPAHGRVARTRSCSSPQDARRRSAGFVAVVARHTGRFYREFLSTRRLVAGSGRERAGPAPRAEAGLGDACGTAPTVPDDLPAAEVLAIAVAARAEGRGVGGDARCAAALEELRRRGVDAARVVTAVGNDAGAADVRARRVPARTGAPRCTRASRKRCSCGLDRRVRVVRRRGRR